MSWFNNFLSAVGIMPGGQDADNFRTGKITTERAQDVNDVSTGAALGLSATWACVNFWAGNIAGLPVTVYRKGPLGIAIEARDHPLFWLLHDSPNYDQSAFEFWEFMCASLELHGNAYAEIERRADGFIVSLTPVRPDIVTVSRLGSGELQYSWSVDNREHKVVQGNMLHVRGFGGGPLGGLSPLAVCRTSFGSALAVNRASSSMYANGARPSGVLTKEGAPFVGTQRKDAEGLLQEKFAGAMNAGRPMLLDGGLKWQQLSMSAKDAEMIESQKLGVEDICRIFEVDPHLVGHTAGNTQLGSSIGDQTLSLLKFKMRKRLKRIEGALEKQLLTRPERKAGVSIEFNVEAFLRADSLGRARYYELMKQFMTVNEVRALEGLGPVPGGDILYRQMQDQPLAAPGIGDKGGPPLKDGE